MNLATSTAVTLVAFCRRPAPGVGKRRLARELGEAATLRISQLLLATTLEDLAAWPGPTVLSPAEPADETWARSLPVPFDDVVAQPDGNLGDRLAAVDRLLRQRGHTRLLYIGSDAPVLAPADYQQAREALGTHDVVLGPALDGGVTCMGSRHPWPDLPGLPWSGEHLHAALQACCESAGMSVRNLAPRYDIDVPDDLHRLCTDLGGDTRPARRALYRALASLGYCRS
ncbi:MAG: TIGR04282 family arsenosugar biosynthesis glycosyltransferase [Gammaproteobacteria bacterium]